MSLPEKSMPETNLSINSKYSLVNLSIPSVLYPKWTEIQKRHSAISSPCVTKKGTWRRRALSSHPHPALHVPNIKGHSSVLILAPVINQVQCYRRGNAQLRGNAQTHHGTGWRRSSLWKPHERKPTLPLPKTSRKLVCRYLAQKREQRAQSWRDPKSRCADLPGGYTGAPPSLLPGRQVLPTGGHR